MRVVPTGHAIEEAVDLAHEIYNRVFRKVPEKLKEG
jgi:DNA-binding protein